MREQDDKSKFLARVGFTQENAELLKAAIRQMARANASKVLSMANKVKI